MGWLPERDRSRGNRAGRWFATSRRPARQEEMMIDYEELAESIGQMREVLRAMVAGLIDDGFTEEQARRITTAILDRQEDEDVT